jgi:exodeoxyribonuclease VII large subunit
MTQNWHGEVVSISGLIDRARLALDAEVGRIAVEAEVFEYRGPHSSGHYYFKLRDEESSIDVKMWRGVASRGLTCRLQEGRSVLAIGRLDIWAKRGTLSFLLDEVHDLGAGDLARRFEELKNRLRLEGLFEEGRKQPIPLRPRKVCVITASPSAAEADMLRTFADARAPFDVQVIPSKVQGDGAADEIARALHAAVGNRPDVILLARGGGSLEDLWAFNEEVLVRAVADCPVPMISAVGHETDFTLCDFAADERAKTPTAGASQLCLGWAQAFRDLQSLAGRLQDAADDLLQQAGQNLQTRQLQLHAQSPVRRLERFRRHVHENELRIAHAIERLLQRRRQRLQRATQRLRAADPGLQMRQLQQRLQGLGARLNAGSPEALLQRGYALVQAKADGPFLRDANDVGVGQTVRISLAQGSLSADVTEIDGGKFSSNSAQLSSAKGSNLRQ